MPADITPQMALAISKNDKASFKNYLVGHNGELISALRSCVQAAEPNLIYLYGISGSGKSHLLFSAMRLAQQEVIHTSYLSLTDRKVGEQMLGSVDVAHIVCIDDVHAWAGEPAKEEALFALFEQIKRAGGQLIISAQQAPQYCGFKLPDLVSRLSSGLVYALQELSEEQQFEALKLRAKHRGLVMADNTVRYLLSRSSRDTSEIFDMLDRIDQASLLEQRKVTIPFLQALLKKS